MKTYVVIGIVTLEKGGETFTDSCDVLINGSGVVNNWKCIQSKSTGAISQTHIYAS